MASWILVNIGSDNDLLPDGTKPLREPPLTYHRLDPKQQTSLKTESNYNNFQSRKCMWKCHLLDNIYIGDTAVLY